MWRFIIIALTLICLVLLGWYAVRKYPGRVEADIQARAQAALAAKGPGVAGVIVKASQRDLVLDGTVASAADRKAALALVEDLSGVKSVTDQLAVGDGDAEPTPVPSETPRADVIEAPAADAAGELADDAKADVGSADARAGADVASADAVAEVAAATVDAGPVVPDTAAAEVAVADTAAAEVAVADTAAAPTPTAADPGGALTPKQCATIIAAMIEGEKRITFRSNTGRLTDEGDAKVKEVAAVLARCPTATGVIEGYHDDYGEPDRIKQLSQIRAFNVHKRLSDFGVDPNRFKYIGLGYRNMKYHGAPKVRILNQRVEFNITVE